MLLLPGVFFSNLHDTTSAILPQLDKSAAWLGESLLSPEKCAKYGCQPSPEAGQDTAALAAREESGDCAAPLAHYGPDRGRRELPFRKGSNPQF
jgi:hypothetical protein